MTELIVREYNAVAIYQRRSDRYLDATAMCRANGKRWPDYYRLDSTKEFVAELSAVVQISTTELVQVRQGGTPQEQGTWVHPRIAISLAQWCSPKFAVMVTGWVEELLTTGVVALQPLSPLDILRQQVAWMEQQQQQLALVSSTAEEAITVARAANARVMAIEDKQDQAEEHLGHVERSEIPAKPKSPRAKVNELARHYVQATGAEYRAVWNRLYKELYYRHGLDVRARHRNNGKSMLDLVEDHGHMDNLYAIASEILVVEQ